MDFQINEFSDLIIAYAPAVVVGLLILIVGWWLAGRFSGYISGMPKSGRLDASIAPILGQFVFYAVLFMTIILALGQFGIETTSLLAVLGAAGLAVALALQGTLSNVAAGIMMLWQRPHRVGEYIDGQGVAGTVTEVGLIGTKLQQADGVFVYVPNSQLWDAAITNYSRESTRRLDIRVGIAYDADISKARKEMLKIAKDDRVLSEPAEPVVHVESLADSAVIVRLRCWTSTADYWACNWEFTEQVKLAFDKAGIEIPFNKIDLNVRQMPEGQNSAA